MVMTIETWKKLPILGGHYEVSTHGRVRACERIVFKSNQHGSISRQVYSSRILKGCPRHAKRRGKYIYHHLGYKKKKYNYACHYLVLITFVGERPDGATCCHNDGDSLNNRVENLRWCTQYENNQDRKRHGNYATGEQHPMNKYSDEFVDRIINKKIDFKSACAETGISISHFCKIRKHQARHAGRINERNQ